MLADSTWSEHVTHVVKKGSKRLYVIRAPKKCGSTDSELNLVYCSIIMSRPVLSDHIDSVQKRALKMIIFPSLCYEDALKEIRLNFAAPKEGASVHNISRAKLLFFRPATKVSAACCTHKTVCP